MALPLQHGPATEIDGLRERFLSAWARTDEIFAIVPDSELAAVPIVWRHPFIFYLGHLPAFSWNQICRAMLQRASFNPYFDDLFCRGIDPDVDTGECHWHPEVPDAWPDLAETLVYRDRVRGALLDFLGRAASDHLAARARVCQMVLEHEFMHQETLMYMLQQFRLERKRRPKSLPRYSFEPAPPLRAITIPAGKARLGAPRSDLTFGWDNEFEETSLDVPAFTMDSLPVTNGEYFEFVLSGAYEERRFWHEKDWRWKQLERKSHPSCWWKRDSDWFYRAMFDALPLKYVSSWPVYVSLAEARAYANWLGRRLPTEAEFHRAAYYGPDGRESTYPWGQTPPTVQHGNFDFVSWSPLPVGSRPAGVSRWGVLELVGNGWELTDTPFAPLPGFAPNIESYSDYSRDFFDGKHFVMKGASWATVADLLRPSFRNWYQAHYPYVFAKFRCVSQ
jgi:ergothioneine biosynthesis protein EgtB